DTAPLYGHGRADEVLVKALGAKRHDVVIATKVGVRWDNEGMHAQSHLDPEWIVTDTEASLRRLRLDVIPLLQVHWPCERDTPLEASLEALTRLQEQGKIRYFGLCNYDAQSLARALELAPVASLQTPYSMIRREFENGLRDVVAPRGADGPAAQRVGVLAYEPLARGLLSGKFRAPPRFPDTDLRARDHRFQEPAFSRIRPLVRALELVGQRVDVPPAALAIAWVCTRPGVSVAIAGAKRPAQVEQNVRAVELLSRHRLWEALAPHVDACRP
ncbi:MAG: aldo/keto reductase, partial [Myxococcales bacterium]|nr:aldo/keto reductase [Myxococcales bacterium]